MRRLQVALSRLATWAGFGALMVLVLSAMPRAAGAQYVINTAHERDQIEFYDTARWSAQMITPALSTIAGAGFRLGYSPPRPVCSPVCPSTGPVESRITYSLWDDDPSAPGALRLATATVTFTLAPYVSQWVDAYWPPVPVVVGRTYWLTIGGGSAFVKTYVLGGPPFPVYEGGDPRRGGLKERDPYSIHSTTVGPRFDLTFRTFAVAPDSTG